MEHHEHHHDHDTAEATATFPTDTAGLPQAAPTQVVELADGDTFVLRIGPVAKRIGDDTVRMIAYNGSIPGPTLRVREGSELVVDVVNNGDLEATVHWHGLRLDNRYDGTHETQAPIPVGGRYSCRVAFPDVSPAGYGDQAGMMRRYGITGEAVAALVTRLLAGRPRRCLTGLSRTGFWPAFEKTH